MCPRFAQLVGSRVRIYAGRTQVKDVKKITPSGGGWTKAAVRVKKKTRQGGARQAFVLARVAASANDHTVGESSGSSPGSDTNLSPSNGFNQQNKGRFAPLPSPLHTGSNAASASLEWQTRFQNAPAHRSCSPICHLFFKRHLHPLRGRVSLGQDAGTCLPDSLLLPPPLSAPVTLLPKATGRFSPNHA